MKTHFFMTGGALALLMALSSWIPTSTSLMTEDGFYLGFIKDDDLSNESYYSFETENEYLDFYVIDTKILSTYNLKSSEYEGAKFSIEYTRDDETGDLALKKLRLIAKAEYDEDE